MKFNKLRVLGFKSFVEPTEFAIEPGLTGVVGPNGCGKSNLVEALRWVMGENSYKNMRASGMDDVIFSGSGNRPSRNTAEVGLFLDNSDRTAPAAFNDADEIQVSRRIERESGSVYRINGKEARAKDVQLLFADASTGARSPSMVGQGRIGELIQAKPQARRQLLEEAAGISGLHSRRHEAELRLRAAETNLERLDDVTSELESQIESLKRQARQANRFKSISADVRQAEATLLHIRWVAAKEAEAAAQSDLAQATSAVAEKAAIQTEAAKEQAIAQLKLPDLRDNEAKAAAAVQRLQIARSQLEEEAKRLADRKAELERRLNQFGADIAREEQLISDNAGTLERLAAEEKELTEAGQNSEAQAIETRTALDTASATLEKSEALLAEITAKRADAAATQTQMERRQKDLADRDLRLQNQLNQAESELNRLTAQIAELPDPLQKQAELDLAEQALADAEKQQAEADAALDQARLNEAAARQPVVDAKARLNEIETESRTILKMLNASAGSDMFPAVVEKMRVETGFEAALGAALGDDLERPLDSSAPAYWSDVGGMGDDPQLPGGIQSLGTVVEAPVELRRRLAQVGIVEEADGARLQAQLRPGQRLVSRDGALWRWDGYVAGADAPSAAAMRLAQKNRLAELDEAANGATRELRKVEEAFQDAAERIAGCNEEQGSARQAYRSASQDLALARDALAAAEKASGQLASRRAVLDEQCTQYRGQLDEIGTENKAVNEALAGMADLSELDQQLMTAQSDVATDRGRAAEARAAHEGLSREAEQRTRRLNAIASERTSWQTRAANAEAHIATLKERSEEAAREFADLADAPDEVETRRRALMSQSAEAESLRSQAADLLAKAESRQRDADRAATEAIAALSQTREARGRAEERLLAAKERRSDAEARIAEELDCAPHLAIKRSGLGPEDPLPDASQVEKRLDRFKIERERLGAVNLRAEEEQAELSERLETIVTEREDVIEAIKKLRTAIQSLNKEGRERLLVAFDKVNDQFRRLFTHLFAGGTAELQLIESDDPLEAGLEILARPPGKKPQTMTLLSGGEQALTAMALIFAVFLTNPAPICVLDEVDAPLDDHNVERFCNLMDEMARTTDTRFVIITHNPITMSRMSRLFGVTMAEQGVSQLVSVDLQTAEGMRDAG